MNRRLRMDIAECERARGFEYMRRRLFTDGDSAE
jgi:hypothetical protein